MTDDVRRVVRPLPALLRPTCLDDIVGHENLLGPYGPIRRMLEGGRPASMILWGPPGSGKTTLGFLFGRQEGFRFHAISAVFSGVKDLREAFQEAETAQLNGLRTILFIDEIHRFHKGQQDALLPVVERGDVILIGATTENPSFALNNALLSRLQVFRLEALTDLDLARLLDRALPYLSRVSHGSSEPNTIVPVILDQEARTLIIRRADGDGRRLIGCIEAIREHLADSEPTETRPRTLTGSDLEPILQAKVHLYDRDQDQHYDLISALHKSVRGSDPDASLYWAARMLEAGEDPRYLARRLLRMAWEDVGLAEPNTPMRALAAWETYERLGSPEGELAILGLVVQLALAEKSNAVYLAAKAAQNLARSTGSLPPPNHIVNAPTRLMKRMGKGKGYLYDHDQPQRFSGQNYFPDGMDRPNLYQPTDSGMEKRYADRLGRFSRLRKENKEHKAE